MKKGFSSNVFAMSLGLVALMGMPKTGWSNGGHEPQIFRAQEEDGTAKEIKANTQVDREKPTAPIESSDVSDVNKENARLKKRLNVLEQERAAARADDGSTDAATMESPADEDVTEKAAEKEDVAPGAEAAAEGSEAAPSAAPVAAPEVKKSTSQSQAAPADLVTSREQEKSSVSAMARAELAAKARAEAKVKAQQEKASKFDAVPDQHVGELAERLKYTNEILKRFGRAYDYRVTTLKEFKHILGELEAQQEKTKALN